MSDVLWFVTDEYEVPITNMMDVDGDDTNIPEEACAIVGPLPKGRWLASACWVGDIVRRKAV